MKRGGRNIGPSKEKKLITPFPSKKIHQEVYPTPLLPLLMTFPLDPPSHSSPTLSTMCLAPLPTFTACPSLYFTVMPPFSLPQSALRLIRRARGREAERRGERGESYRSCPGRERE